jgi:uncharacterized oligopeptide transporter (OPT) family protein
MSEPLQLLTPEQVREWSLEKKDLWWKQNVFRGDMPQLTLRAALTGMILGGVLSLTNLYVGIRTGWTLGVGITSVTLSFALFKLFSKLNWGKEMTILENNAMQSIATSAGYMTAPLVSSIPAYMLVTQQVIPAWHTWIWIVLLSILGVLFAFPLKKRYINDDQLPFPEGYAAGVVMHNLHSGEGKDGVFKAKVLLSGAAVASLVELFRSEKVMHMIRLPFLKLPEYWDDFVYKFATPSILGTPLKDLTVQWDTSLVLFSTGGLMSVKVARSMLLGAFINYWVLAPVLISQGIMKGPGYKNISMWSLWFGAAIMTTASLYSFFSKPEIFKGLFRFGKAKTKKVDQLKDIELPMSVFAWGIPLTGALVVFFGHYLFNIHWVMGLIAIPLVFVMTIIAVNSTALTAITPGGALSKLTQITYSVIAPGNIGTNVMTAGITTEVTLNASNLLMDIKPGYMLGAKPRQQAVGHVLGIFAGSLVVVPVYYAMFHGDLSMLTSDVLPMPSAQVWKSVAEVLTQGLSSLHPTARWGMLVGAILGIVIEALNQRTHGRFPISGMGLGLAFVLRFTDSLSMALGSFFFAAIAASKPAPKSVWNRAFVENQETMAAGGIAGGSIIGIILILIETLA